jgi:hypothetical protein
LYLNHNIINDIISECAKYGLFNHLKWFRKKEFSFSKQTFKYEALHGNIEIMKWL